MAWLGWARGKGGWEGRGWYSRKETWSCLQFVVKLFCLLKKRGGAEGLKESGDMQEEIGKWDLVLLAWMGNTIGVSSVLTI